MLEALAEPLTDRIQWNRRGFSVRERAIMLVLAETALPAGDIMPAPDEATIDRVENQIDRFPTGAWAALRSILWGLELGAVAWRGRRFSKLSSEKRLRYLKRWQNGETARRLALRTLVSPIKVAQYDNPKIFELMDCPYSNETPSAPEKARWRQGIMRLPDFEDDETLEADVVVVGTGAGGAAIAKELAEKGVAVAMVEAGGHFDRTDFDGRAMNAMDKMYYGRGMVFSVGSPPILIPSGKTVGGTTTVNSGTCFRVPDRILEKWQNQFGLTDFTPEMMAPYFERVESVIQVEEGQAEYLGGCARVIARGCDALGYTHHGPLYRNAPECDGQGVCCFGCPTDAKKSTNVSYVPMALRNHASLFTEAKVTEILIENGRAAGVIAEATVGDNGSRSVRRLTIRARAVVVSGGTYHTPVLLLKNKLCGTSGELGKNLTLHPAAATMAVFDEEIRGWNAIPQGYSIHEFWRDRMMFEGGFTPLDVSGAALGIVGPEFTEVMEAYNRTAAFGFMVEDSSRGRVRVGPTGAPLVTYNLNKADVEVVKLGTARLAEIYFAAGAKRVYPCIAGHDVIKSTADLKRLHNSKVKALDLMLSAYHPLGTARLGVDPTTSVVGPDHQAHDLPGLYIVDGSSVPSSLGVNPQVTIMAMATRAADLLADRLS